MSSALAERNTAGIASDPLCLVTAMLSLRRWFNTCSQLQHPAQIIRIAPRLDNLTLSHPVNEGCGKGLPPTMAGYAKEALLQTGVCRTYDHFVPFGNHVLNAPLLLDRAE